MIDGWIVLCNTHKNKYWNSKYTIRLKFMANKADLEHEYFAIL